MGTAGRKQLPDLQSDWLIRLEKILVILDNLG
jgi:hypothetical protein